MNPIEALRRPEYIFRPTQIARRLRHEYFGAPGGMAIQRLPWGLDIEVCVNENIGRAIMVHGVHELGVSECLWRLLDRGENALDVGANVGYMTSLLAARAGPTGTVVAFEPHPDLLPRMPSELWLE